MIDGEDILGVVEDNLALSEQSNLYLLHVRYVTDHSLIKLRHVVPTC